MRRRTSVVAVVGAWCLAALAMSRASVASDKAGEPAAGEERAFIEKHASEIVKLEPSRLKSAGLERVFRVSFYDVSVVIQQGDGGSETSHVLVARLGEELVPVTKPSTTAEVPRMKELVLPQFKLKTEKDAAAVQEALDALYPISTDFGDKDKKAKAIKHSGHDWVFVRGEFFKKHQGFVFTTDAGGAVVGVKYSLELP